jgi:hypothetical protein
MKQNKKNGSNKYREQENQKRNNPSNKDGFRYDYDDSSDVR